MFTPIPLDSTDGPAAVSGVRSGGRGGSDMSFNSQPDSKSSIILKRGQQQTIGITSVCWVDFILINNCTFNV